jgi:hypothetical protein
VNSKRIAVFPGTLAIVVMVIGVALLNGCGGDADSCGYGGARGYVYESTTGATTIVSASPTPPAGFVPVPAGTVVRIEGFPALTTNTSLSGFYYIPQILEGLRDLVVVAPDGTLVLEIPIIAGRITEGAGHQEGGGGLG